MPPMQPIHPTFLPPRVSRRSKKVQCGPGFTLAEILVVISIVGVLLALLFPASRSAMESMRTNRTIHQLRQLQTANLAYAADHDSWFVPLRKGPGVFQNGWRWNEDFLQYLDLDLPLQPGSERFFGSGFYSETHNLSLLAYNAYRVPGGDTPWSGAAPHALRQPVILYPASLIAFADASDWWLNPFRWNDWAGAETHDVSTASPGPMIAYRNRGERAAVVTYAGNVELLERNELNPLSAEGRRRWFYNEP